MDIQYFGHSCFKIRTKSGSVVADPYTKSVGLQLPTLSADIVTVSHDHEDHNNAKVVSGTARRKIPFVVTEPGEYEVEGISIFGYLTMHDDKKGQERGENVVYIIQAEGIRVLHLGDLGNVPEASLIEELNGVDVLLVPVGGTYTINPKQALEVIEVISPSVVVPMHYKTDKHNQEAFGKLATVEDFVSEYGSEARRVEEKLTISRLSLQEDSTEVVILEVVE